MESGVSGVYVGDIASVKERHLGPSDKTTDWKSVIYVRTGVRFPPEAKLSIDCNHYINYH